MKPVGQVISMIASREARAAAVAPPAPPSGLEPAPPAEIRGWLLTLAKTRMAGKPGTSAELSAEIADIIFTCGDLLAGCWTEETLRKAKGHFKWWPGPALLREFLEPIANAARAEIVERNRPVLLPARECQIPYNPGPALDPIKRQRSIETLAAAEAEAEDAKAERNSRQQLAALGFTRETVPPPVPRLMGVTVHAANDQLSDKPEGKAG